MPLLLQQVIKPLQREKGRRAASVALQTQIAGRVFDCQKCFCMVPEKKSDRFNVAKHPSCHYYYSSLQLVESLADRADVHVCCLL